MKKTILLFLVAVLTVSLWVMDLIFESLILNGLLKIITGF